MSSSQCAICGKGNPAAAKFCNECGAPLETHERPPVPAAEPTDAEWLLDFEPTTIGGFEKQRQRLENAPVRLGLLPRRRSHAVKDLVELFGHERVAATARLFPNGAATDDSRTVRAALTRVGLPVVGVAAVAIVAYVVLSGNPPSAAKVDSPPPVQTVETRATPEAPAQGRIRTADTQRRDKEIEGAGDSQSSAAIGPVVPATAAEPAVNDAPKQKPTRPRDRSQTRPAPTSVTAAASPDTESLTVRAPVRNARNDTGIETPTARPCTEQVAALGLCSVNQR